MSVHWTKPNDFTHCRMCKADGCHNRSVRLTAGCANGKRDKDIVAQIQQMMTNEVES